MFREVLAVVSGDHTYHAVPVECGGSVKAYRVHRDVLWGATEGFTWTVAYKGIRSVRGLTVEDISCSNVASVVKSVQKGEFTKNVAIGCECERLVGSRMESYPAILGASHCLIGEDVYPYLKRRERRTVMVKLNKYSVLSVSAKYLLKAEATL